MVITPVSVLSEKEPDPSVVPLTLSPKPLVHGRVMVRILLRIPNGGNPLRAPPTYSRLWWTDASVPYAAALGRHGQNIIVLPDQDVGLVVTSKTADTSPRSSAVDMVKRYLLPAIKADGALPEDSVGQAKLAQAVRDLGAVGKHESQQPNRQAEALAKRTFILEPNDWRLPEFALTLSGPDPSFRFKQAARTFPFLNMSLGGPMGTRSVGRLNDWRVLSSRSSLWHLTKAEWRFPMWTATIVHSKFEAFRRSD